MPEIKDYNEPRKNNVKGKLFWLLLSIIIIVSFGAFVLLNFRSRTVVTANKSEVKEFKIKASQYFYEPNVITVKRGDNVKLVINNTDKIHGIRFPELRVSGDDAVEFTANKIGEFIWYCNNYCGAGHRQMQGKLIVE